MKRKRMCLPLFRLVTRVSGEMLGEERNCIWLLDPKTPINMNSALNCYVVPCRYLKEVLWLLSRAIFLHFIKSQSNFPQNKTAFECSTSVFSAQFKLKCCVHDSLSFFHFSIIDAAEPTCIIINAVIQCALFAIFVCTLPLHALALAATQRIMFFIPMIYLWLFKGICVMFR